MFLLGKSKLFKLYIQKGIYFSFLSVYGTLCKPFHLARTIVQDFENMPRLFVTGT